MAGVGGVDLLEAVEDGVQLVGRDAAAFVDDFEQDGVLRRVGVDADGGCLGRELDGVGEQVGQHLQDAVRIAVEEERLGCGGLRNRGGYELKVDHARVGHGAHRFNGLLAELTERAAADLQRGAAGLHALQIKDVVDEADETISIGSGDAEEIEGLGIDVADGAGGEQAERTADAGQRGAQLVGDGRDELVLESVELRPLVEWELVLMLLLAGPRQLFGQFAGRALGAKETR